MEYRETQHSITPKAVRGLARGTKPRYVQPCSSRDWGRLCRRNATRSGNAGRRFCNRPGFTSSSPRSRAILKKVLNGSSGIATRHLALENLGQAFDLTPDVLHARFARNAPAARHPGRGTRAGQLRQPAGRN